jgi:hypothetical protein
MTGARGRPIWIPLTARVEWHEGRRGRERPEAVVLGGDRLTVTVEESLLVGPAVAGLPTRRVFVVRAGDGRRLRITALSGGCVVVEAAAIG